MILLYIYLFGIPLASFLFWLIPNPVPAYHWSDHVVIPLIVGALWPLWLPIVAGFFLLFLMLGL